ncbi:MAG: hypothetical protein KKD77_20030 [Gammaproteobacteria bacterium]|nr:hypothetical protein [Gammaproteobacteria bacterium]
MAFGNYGHITLTLADTPYNFLVDLATYQEVDIVDFAPRALSGSPAWSEMGLYLDIAQEGFKHGFGKWTYSEPQSYSYTGTNVDTRHGHASLFTKATPIATGGDAGLIVKKILIHESIVFLLTNLGLCIVSPTSGILTDYVGPMWAYDIIDTGRYLLLGQSGQTQVLDVFNATASTNNTVTGQTDEDWAVNIFAGATAYIVQGVGAGGSYVVTSNTANQLTIVGTWALNPDATSYIIVIGDTAQASADNFGGFGIFGGYYWAYEYGKNYLHFGAEADGSDLEGGGVADTAVVTVGAPGTSILGLESFNNQLWVFKEDGAWTVGEDNLAYHTLNFAAEVSPNNFQTHIVWNGFLLFSVRNTIYKYRSGLQDMSPPIFNEYPPYKQFGWLTGLTTRGTWAYVMGISNQAGEAGDEAAPETTAGFGALLATDGVGWHKLWTFPQTAPTYLNMWLDNVNDKLYIFGYSGGRGYIYTIPLQVYSDLPYASYDITTYRNLYTSYYDMSLPRIPKSFASITIAGDFPTNTSARVQYQIDDATTWTTLATYTADMTENDFPIGTTGKRIRFRLQLYTTGAAVSPHIKAIILKVMIRPSVLYGVTCDVLVSDKLSDQNRLMNGLTASDIRTALKACRDSVSPILFTSLYGDAAGYAYLASLRFLVIGYEDSDDVESIARCTIVHV